MIIEKKEREEGQEEKKKEGGKKKKGRRPKDYKERYELNKDQTKFFVDLTRERENKEMVFNLLVKANDKSHGQEITFKDLALFGMSKLTPKDIEKVQENSLSKMEKVELALVDYNLKNGTDLDLGEFLVKKLSLN